MKRNKMVSSFSDDKLYRGHRRKNILPYDSSATNNTESIKTSSGGPNLRIRIKTVDIEGDGPLGIIFSNFNNDLKIDKIINDTVKKDKIGATEEEIDLLKKHLIKEYVKD